MQYFTRTNILDRRDLGFKHTHTQEKEEKKTNKNSKQEHILFCAFDENLQKNCVNWWNLHDLRRKISKRFSIQPARKSQQIDFYEKLNK